MIRKYNQTSFAISNQHQLLPGAYATYQAFVNAGLCDCVRRYLSYLTYWVTNQIPPNHPMPVDIWNYEGCKVEEPEVPCYEEYLQTVYTYNAFVLNNQFEQLPPIRVIVKEQIFYQEELCDCLGEWQAYLTMIMSPVVRDKQEDVIPNLYLERFCPENPCIEHPDSLAGTPLPPIEYINPCETQLINFAYGGAVLAYEQYVDSLTSDFVARYNEHCLSVVELLDSTITTRRVIWLKQFRPLESKGWILFIPPISWIQTANTIEDYNKTGHWAPVRFSPHTA
jgi:hypothetical protein